MSWYASTRTVSVTIFAAEDFTEIYGYLKDHHKRGRNHKEPAELVNVHAGGTNYGVSSTAPCISDETGRTIARITRNRAVRISF
jgi:hypothetical protein